MPRLVAAMKVKPKSPMCTQVAVIQFTAGTRTVPWTAFQADSRKPTFQTAAEMTTTSAMSRKSPNHASFLVFLSPPNYSEPIQNIAVFVRNEA